jgi:hypothetical protein
MPRPSYYKNPTHGKADGMTGIQRASWIASQLYDDVSGKLEETTEGGEVLSYKKADGTSRVMGYPSVGGSRHWETGSGKPEEKPKDGGALFYKRADGSRTTSPLPPLINGSQAYLSEEQERNYAEGGRRSYRRMDGKPKPYAPPTVPADGYGIGDREAESTKETATSYIGPFDTLTMEQGTKIAHQQHNESMLEQLRMREQLQPQESLIAKGLAADNALKIPEAYTQPFCDFLTENPTVFHAVSHFETKLEKAGFKKVLILIRS